MAQQPRPYDPFAPMQDEPPTYAPPPRRRRSGVLTAVLALAVILAAGILVNESALRIRTVNVVGNERVSWEEVVTSAGLRGSVSYFSLNEDRIRQNVNLNRYLIFEGMEKQFPSAVTLYVRERRPCANVQVMGVNYQMDDEGMILEKMGGVQPDNGLINVTGFQTKQIRVGEKLAASVAEQMTAYNEVMQEVIQQGFAGEVSELNLSNPDSLYLITRDGYTVHLGDSAEMRAKIGTVRAVVVKLREMGKTGGRLEASTPAVATYMPMDD